MLTSSPHFIFYAEQSLLESSSVQSDCISFINKISYNKCYFFTHNCDISRKTLYEKLQEKNIPCKLDKIMTPTYLLLKYCLNLYNNPLKVYPISNSKDYNDFYALNLEITNSNPDLFFICTNIITEDHLDLLSKYSIPLILSSNLCHDRLLNCESCSRDCIIKCIKDLYKDRIIIPDIPPDYNSYNLFKYFNIIPKNTVVLTEILRDDYIQYERTGCKTILILRNKNQLSEYIASPYDISLVLDNLDNLSYFFNLGTNYSIT